MVDCMIIGDSIAVGTHLQRYECVSYAKGGINSWQWNNMYVGKDLTAKTVIISLGSNDHKYVKTYDELKRMRDRVHATKVFWILPHGNLKASGVDIETIQQHVKDIALQYSDTVLPIGNISPDKIHPTTTGYRELARQTK